MKDRKISKVCEIQKAQPVAEAVLCSLLVEAMGLFRSSTVCLFSFIGTCC